MILPELSEIPKYILVIRQGIWFNIKTAFPDTGIPITKIRWSLDSHVLIMRIPISVSLYQNSQRACFLSMVAEGLSQSKNKFHVYRDHFMCDTHNSPQRGCVCVGGGCCTQEGLEARTVAGFTLYSVIITAVVGHIYGSQARGHQSRHNHGTRLHWLRV